MQSGYVVVFVLLCKESNANVVDDAGMYNYVYVSHTAHIIVLPHPADNVVVEPARLAVREPFAVDITKEELVTAVETLFQRVLLLYTCCDVRSPWALVLNCARKLEVISVLKFVLG